MKTALTVAGYTLGLIAVFGAAAGLGALVSPSVTGAATTGPSATAHGEMSDSTAPVPAGAAAWPGGLMVAQDGYTLSLADRSLPADAHAQLRFQILGPDGAPVIGYETEHDKQLHLILVRRDLDQFQHVHPVLDPAGTWSVPVDLSAAGSIGCSRTSPRPVMTADSSSARTSRCPGPTSHGRSPRRRRPPRSPAVTRSR